MEIRDTEMIYIYVYIYIYNRTKQGVCVCVYVGGDVYMCVRVCVYVGGDVYMCVRDRGGGEREREGMGERVTCTTIPELEYSWFKATEKKST